MPLSLTQNQIKQFRLNGYLVLKSVLSSLEVDILADHCDLIASGRLGHIPESSIQLEPVFRNEGKLVSDRVLSVRKLSDLAVHDDTMWAHATNSKIVDVISDLLNTEDIKLYGDQLFMKASNTGSAQPWHQDSASWRDIVPMDLITAWTAIDHATTENGCLNFAPGTHQWGMLRGHRLSPITDDLDRGRWPVIPVPLSRGSISFHHSLVLHQSNANLSQMRRRGYATHYMRASSFKDESIKDAPQKPQFRQVRGRSLSGRV
ncbi:MAG: hypothetical protein DF168_00755 [Candidatus Moanabacter tarae]|uniref:Ectoine dioxygenase n=1 Tax=Candidatus Moanibacter tarae TaxID=2200854 RepID=A0A2Z4AH78_9BACT|nr:MAG: hypothetical protein DF168_00755 [Candidatus Moanabacter tarae]